MGDGSGRGHDAFGSNCLPVWIKWEASTDPMFYARAAHPTRPGQCGRLRGRVSEILTPHGRKRRPEGRKVVPAELARYWTTERVREFPNTHTHKTPVVDFAPERDMVDTSPLVDS